MDWHLFSGHLQTICILYFFKTYLISTSNNLKCQGYDITLNSYRTVVVVVL